jgi:hypothetical protein
MVINVLYDGLEKFLNDVENLASGAYEIVSILPFSQGIKTEKHVVGVVIKFILAYEDDIEFNEDVIRRLGF